MAASITASGCLRIGGDMLRPTDCPTDGLTSDSTMHPTARGSRSCSMRMNTANFLTMVAISPDSRLVAAAVDDWMTVWALEDGTQRASFDAAPLLNPTAGSALNLDFTFSRDGNLLMGLTQRYGDAVGVFELSSGRVLARLDLPTVAGLSPRISEFLTDFPQATLKGGLSASRELCIAIAGETGSHGSDVPMALATYDLTSGALSFEGRFEADQVWFIEGVHCSPDGRWMVVAAADEASSSRLFVWDRHAGAIHDRIDTTTRNVLSIGPGSRYLAMSAADGTDLYDVNSRRMAAEGLGDRSASTPAVFGPNGELIGRAEHRSAAYLFALLPEDLGLIGAASAAVSHRFGGPIASERVSLWALE